MEIGCGGHLHNLHVLSPGIRLYGFDISEGQIDFWHRKYPNLVAWVSTYDITVASEQLNLSQTDIAYTQAVIMQIRQNHLNAFGNLFRIANHQAIPMVNWLRHEFMRDIEGLFTSNKLPW